MGELTEAQMALHDFVKQLLALEPPNQLSVPFGIRPHTARSIVAFLNIQAGKKCYRSFKPIRNPYSGGLTVQRIDA